MKTALYANKIFSDQIKEPGAQLQRIIQAQAPDIRLETIDSITGLSQRLCQPAHKISVTILMVQSEIELIGLGSLTALFNNTRVILILWDREKALLIWANNLRPSYISYADSDLREVILVLKKIQKLRARAKTISHFRRPCIPPGCVAKTRRIPDMPAFSRLAGRAPELLKSANLFLREPLERSKG